METDLSFILRQKDSEISPDVLRKIKIRLNCLTNSDQLERIRENKKNTENITYMPADKTIEVNFKLMIDYLNDFEQSMKIDIPNATDEDIRLIKLLIAYKMFLHEIYHAKQLYNAFETNEDDMESEIIRSIYNMSRKKYLQEIMYKPRRQIMEERIYETNRILLPYADINPIERKAEIEALKQVRNIITPLKDKYMKVYDELHLIELSKMMQGYEKAEVPFIRIIEILKTEDPNFRIMLPYGCNNKKELFETTETVTTERDRLEFGLNITGQTKEKVYEKISMILDRKLN